MSRLLTTLLLYRNGFYVGKYISLEAKIAKNKDLYYSALAASQSGWHEGSEDVVPFMKYMLGTILAAYKDFEERMAFLWNPNYQLLRWSQKQANLKSVVLRNRIYENCVPPSVTVLLRVHCARWLLLEN